MLKRLARSGLIVSAFLLAGCGDDSGSSGDRDAVIELLEGEGETPESAACFADELSGYDLAQMETFVETGEGPDGLSDDVAQAAEKCAATAGEDAPEDAE